MKINKIFLLALIISLLIHISIFYSLHFFKQKKEKQEEKPIFITLNYEKQKEKPKEGTPERKIPKKTKLKTAQKSSIPKHSFNKNSNKKNISKKETKKQQTNVKNKEKSKINKTIEKTKPEKIKTQEKATKKVVISKEKPQEKEKVVNKKPQQDEEKNQVKQPNLPLPKIENKELKIAENQKTKKEDEKLPQVPIPPAENNKAKEEKPPKELNISHLKGKNQIFQMGEEKPKKEGTTKKDEDIMKYLYYVRDRLQENLAYPLTAKRLEIEGTVIVRFIIKKDGTVDTKEIKIVKSSGSNILDKQAIITVENSIPFKPPPNNKSIVVEIPVIFEIIRSEF